MILSKIFKYSVDTLNIKLEEFPNIKGANLLANKYNFEFYEMSRFYGINLFLKKVSIQKLNYSLHQNGKLLLRTG